VVRILLLNENFIRTIDTIGMLKNSREVGLDSKKRCRNSVWQKNEYLLQTNKHKTVQRTP